MNPKCFTTPQAYSTWISSHAILSLINTVLAVWLVSAASAAPAQADTVHWLTLVSLTFDDGNSDQSAARTILLNHGMNGTFYVNSDRIGSSTSFLNWEDLYGLYKEGNEIAGHTIGHVDLATLSDAQQKDAICNDMQSIITNMRQLQQLHNDANPLFTIDSFAYPFSSTGPNTQTIVKNGCPAGTYKSARAVGGLVSGTSCSNCLWAETIPPGNPYYISTNDSVKSATTLADLQSYVTQAENNGGGWVPLVFHHVCNGCSTLAVSPAVLSSFLDWLSLRATPSQGTYVRTVHQVMTGDYPSPPQITLGNNLLKNPSLEIDANNNLIPDCWQRGGFGTNTATWVLTSDAHSGNIAQQVQITNYSSGDRKLVPTLDAGQATNNGCAPNVSAGENYQLSAWYKSTTQTAVVLYYLDANGVWQYWRDGPLLPAANSWTQMIYTPGAVPNGAKAISFGIALSTNGTLITDDYAVQQVLGNPPPSDTTPPVISSFAPADGTAVSGTVTLAASVSDNVAVQQVDFLINGSVVGSDTTSPYSISWNSASVANGSVQYTLRATDTSGNPTVSAIHQLTVQNDTSPPTVSFNQPPTPAQGATVTGPVTLAATATDDIGVTRVDFLVNSSVVGSTNVATNNVYQVTWNSSSTANGTAALTAKAFDAAGNNAVTTAVNVTVNNQTSGNLVKNPSLETDANNDQIPDCWQLGGNGTNTYTWTRTSGSAHDGNFAEKVQITQYSSGDRKLLIKRDSGTCAPAVTPGARYTLTAWYKSTISTGIKVLYRNSSGTWTTWITGPSLPIATAWTKATYTTPAIPAGATALSFGIYLKNVGILETDDYSMVAVQ